MSKLGRPSRVYQSLKLRVDLGRGQGGGAQGVRQTGVLAVVGLDVGVGIGVTSGELLRVGIASSAVRRDGKCGREGSGPLGRRRSEAGDEGPLMGIGSSGMDRGSKRLLVVGDGSPARCAGIVGIETPSCMRGR